jgi:hypothetical protein
MPVSPARCDSLENGRGRATWVTNRGLVLVAWRVALLCSALLGVGSGQWAVMVVVTIQWLLVLVLVVGGWCCTAAAGSGTSVHLFRKKHQNDGGLF